jgi:integrase/recombinase XerD
MIQAEQSTAAGSTVSTDQATTYRDGLIIALLAAVPLRRRTIACLRLEQNLVKVGDAWSLQIDAIDNKSRRSLEFSLPAALNSRLDTYLQRFRPHLLESSMETSLWLSGRRRPMSPGAIYTAVRNRTKVAFGIPVNLHHFRSAAGSFWSMRDPANVIGVKDLLGHVGFDTTEKHYIAAQTRLAGRALAEVLRAHDSQQRPARERCERRSRVRITPTDL